MLGSDVDRICVRDLVSSKIKRCGSERRFGKRDRSQTTVMMRNKDHSHSIDTMKRISSIASLSSSITTPPVAAVLHPSVRLRSGCRGGRPRRRFHMAGSWVAVLVADVCCRLDQCEMRKGGSSALVVSIFYVCCLTFAWMPETQAEDARSS